MDRLIRKSEKDLWREDLEGLQVEWRVQIEEEARREKKVKSKGRRASAKLGIGGKGKKRGLRAVPSRKAEVREQTTTMVCVRGTTKQNAMC